MKALVFDSGSIINFSLNGMLDLFAKLKKEFNGKFVVPQDVEYETIKRPMSIKKYELSALKVKDLLDKGIFELADTLGVKESEIEEKTKEVLNIANHTFFADEKAINIIDRGEASCLAVSGLFSNKKIDNVIVLDERTTRMLCEKPENLRKLFEKKLHEKIEARRENFPFSQDSG